MSSPGNKPTSEMIEYYYDRTEKHVQMVKDFFDALKDRLPSSYKKMSIRHDADKYKEPLLTPYIFISWEYHKKGYKAPDSMQEEMSRATKEHVLNNDHHPEFYDKKNAEINKRDRDAVPDKIIDASSMPESALIEMCCDWGSVSWERDKKSPRDWADKMIGKRWKFTDAQKEKIYHFIDLIEEVIEDKPAFLK